MDPAWEKTLDDLSLGPKPSASAFPTSFLCVCVHKRVCARAHVHVFIMVWREH